MTILANILARKKQIQDEIKVPPMGQSETADRLKRKGLDAIQGGPGKVVVYMKEFAVTAEELARLIPTDGSEVRGDMNDARAYLIANGPCGVDTVSRLEVNITGILDQPFP
jgi:hypothetical protein